LLDRYRLGQYQVGADTKSVRDTDLSFHKRDDETALV
jgi:hypothetical protein